MFLKIDDWSFDKIFQPFADWFCDRTGRSPHWLAATFAYLYIAGVILEQIYFPNNSWLSLAFDAVMAVVVIDIATNHDEEDKKKITTLTATMNPVRRDIFWQFMRITGWLALLLNISDIIRNDIETSYDMFRCLQISLLVCLFYFEACEAKPPAPPKKKEVMSTKLAHSAP